MHEREGNYLASEKWTKPEQISSQFFLLLVVWD
jgi:hypothetical protein